MELIFRPKFFREFKRISNKEVLKELSFIFKQIDNATKMEDIGGIKKLRDYTYYYRIKIKISEKYDYRLVLMIKNNKVWAESIALESKIFYKE